MPRPIVYLAGAINGKSDAEANDWRRQATEALSTVYDVLDPMRRDYRGVEAQNVNDIVVGDLADIHTASVVLVKADAPSWGTAMELVYAKEFGAYVIGFGAGDRPSPWLTFHTDVLLSGLDTAVLVLRELALHNEERKFNAEA